MKPDVPTDGTGRYEAVKRPIAALFDVPLLCFSDKFDQDLTNYSNTLCGKFARLLTSEAVSMYRASVGGFAASYVSDTHTHTRRIGLEEICLETYVLPREVVCHSRAIVCELIAAVLTRQQLWYIC